MNLLHAGDGNGSLGNSGEFRVRGQWYRWWRGWRYNASIDNLVLRDEYDEFHINYNYGCNAHNTCNDNDDDNDNNDNGDDDYEDNINVSDDEEKSGNDDNNDHDDQWKYT